MNKPIWKFEIEVVDRQYISIPAGAEILTVQVQNGHPCLWAIVEPNMATIDRLITTYGTGHPISHTNRYIGTYQLDQMVFHVFDV